MNAPASTLPVLIRSAADALLHATDSAELLETISLAGVAYDAAKVASKLARAKDAHDAVLADVYRAQGQALQIEARAKMRLADEYDAAQQRGEVKTQSDNQLFADEKKLSADDIGLSPHQIHEARRLRDAENENPGIVEKTIENSINDGKEPTRAAVKAACKPAKKSSPGQSNQKFYRLVKAWESAGPAAQRRFLEYLDQHMEDAA